MKEKNQRLLLRHWVDGECHLASQKIRREAVVQRRLQELHFQQVKLEDAIRYSKGFSGENWAEDREETGVETHGCQAC